MIKIGAIFTTNSYGLLEVTSYSSSIKVGVRFIDTGYETVTSLQCIRIGSVKDKLKPSVWGVGFMGVGNHSSTGVGGMTKAYRCWVRMLERCYSCKYHKNKPTYIGCTVDVSWHNFQVFAKWYAENYIDGYHLDKDIKLKGNRVYGPETCMFVSLTDNNIEAQAKSYTLISPDGEIVKVYNLAEFCRNNNLSPKGISLVNTGLRKHYKKWRFEL